MDASPAARRPRLHCRRRTRKLSSNSSEIGRQGLLFQYRRTARSAARLRSGGALPVGRTLVRIRRAGAGYRPPARANRRTHQRQWTHLRQREDLGCIAGAGRGSFHRTAPRSADKAFYSNTDARPEVQRGFDPVARYQSAGPWSGFGGPALATGRRLVLTGALTSANGRISGSEKTSAALQAPDAEAFIEQLRDRPTRPSIPIPTHGPKCSAASIRWRATSRPDPGPDSAGRRWLPAAGSC